MKIEIIQNAAFVVSFPCIKVALSLSQVFSILECIKQLKIKNCEGYDRIPQRFLIDGIEILIKPLFKLFSLIYRDKQIPEQWLIAKITPIHKKRFQEQR